MRTQFLVFVFIWLPLYGWAEEELTNYAWVKVPVTDCVTRSLGALDKTLDSLKWYKALPYAPDEGVYSCMRLHQLLFNEIVKVKQTVQDEVECELIDCFYTNGEGKERRDCWLQKKDVLLLNDIPKNLLGCIPQGKNYLSLIWPWHDPISKITFSAGTQFVRNTIKDTHFSYAIVFINPKSLKKELRFISKKSAVMSSEVQTPVTQKKIFLSVLEKWAQGSPTIPYVFGGCSIIKQFTHNKFTNVKVSMFDMPGSVWKRSPFPQGALSGIDCSGLLFRAAKIAQLPWHFKNSSAITAGLKPMSAEDVLQEGDIIWYKGHVVVVSDVKKNEFIESIGYQSGFGKVHKLSVKKAFAGINTYGELVDTYLKQKPVVRLGHDGKPYKKLDGLKIYKFSSLSNMSTNQST